MFGSEMLEVGIGLIFIFILISIVCAAIREGIEGVMKSRAAHLEFAIRELLCDREGMGLARGFYNHPLIFSLYSGEYPGALTAGPPTGLTRGGSLPSYIPKKNFSLALVDLAVRGEETDAVSGDPESPRITAAALRANLRHLDNPHVQRMLLAGLDAARDDLDKLQEVLQEWYDSSMDRVSGMYKRSTQWIIFGVGLTVAIVLNVNAVAIAKYLFRNESARTALVAAAEVAAADSTFLQQSAGQAQQSLAALDLPIGWLNPAMGIPGGDTDARAWVFFLLASLVGWLITAVAVSLGAPFWFDVLNKVMVIRSTVKPKEKSGEEGSEDRPLTEAKAAVVAVERTPEGADRARAPVAPAPVVSVGVAVTASVRDVESQLDGCDVEFDQATPDEMLPPSRGGVQ